MHYKSAAAFMSRAKQVEIDCRNGNRMKGRIKLYDKHFNVVIVNKEGEEIFIRGDGIIKIIRK